MQFLLKYILPGMIGLLLGVIGGPWIQRPPSCPECPDVTCPDNVAIKMNPLDLGDLRKFKGDITQTTAIEGDVYLICDGDTTGPYAKTRSLIPNDSL